MKVLSLFFVCLSATFSLLSVAHAQDAENRDSWEVREVDLGEVEIKEEANLDRSQLADESVVTKKGRSYKIDSKKIDAITLERFQQMPAEKQENFHKIRRAILEKTAAVLDGAGLTIGAGIVAKNKLMGVFKKKDPTAVKVTAREAGMQTVEGILNALNAKFWGESAKIADAKEVTFFFSPTGQISLGVPKIKIGGSLGATIAFGYSKKTGTMFVDIFANVERLKSGFVVFAGVKVLTGLNFDSSPELGKRLAVVRGETYFPAVLPLWEASGRDHYSFGVSTALSIPPPPITDVFNYRNDVHRIRLVRISRDTWKEFVFYSMERLGATEKQLFDYAERVNLNITERGCRLLFF